MKDIEKIYATFIQSTGICIDSRKLKKNEIFFALRGEHFNGNSFAIQALQQGALAVVVDDRNVISPELKSANNIFVVDNVLATLQALA